VRTNYIIIIINIIIIIIISISIIVTIIIIIITLYVGLDRDGQLQEQMKALHRVDRERDILQEQLEVLEDKMEQSVTVQR